MSCLAQGPVMLWIGQAYMRSISVSVVVDQEASFLVLNRKIYRELVEGSMFRNGTTLGLINIIQSLILSISHVEFSHCEMAPAQGWQGSCEKLGDVRKIGIANSMSAFGSWKIRGFGTIAGVIGGHMTTYSRAEGARQRIGALSSRVQSVAHTGTRTPRPIPVKVLSAVAHAAPASSAAAALRDSDLHQPHIPRGPRGPRPRWIRIGGTGAASNSTISKERGRHFDAQRRPRRP
ncbi:hypothetical protein B0H11DRAFT_1920551 [Mycena galericulata]|nr:hypothetical protein B0H11DRAFT_1920551 [Mycena galericulata]